MTPFHVSPRAREMQRLTTEFFSGDLTLQELRDLLWPMVDREPELPLGIGASTEQRTAPAGEGWR